MHMTRRVHALERRFLPRPQPEMPVELKRRIIKIVDNIRIAPQEYDVTEAELVGLLAEQAQYKADLGLA